MQDSPRVTPRRNWNAVCDTRVGPTVWLGREDAECFHGACARCIELGAALEQEILLEGRVQS